MPRKDPITGVMVMTNAEFWAHEAKHEGKGRESWELQEEFYHDMEKARLEEEDKLRTPAHALMILQGAVEAENKYRKENKERLLAMPVKVLEVKSAAYSDGFRETSTKITATAISKGKRKGTIEFSTWSTRGSFYEPPDGETEITWNWG